MRALFTAMLLCASVQAVAQSVAPTPPSAADVAVVSHVSGEVAYLPSSYQVSGKLTPYMRVRDGDRVNMASGALLRLVFFDTGRQESWAGPASLRTAKGSAQPLSGAPADVVVLSASAPVRLARLPELLQNARLGGVQVRGAVASGASTSQRERAVGEARAAYEHMRRVLPASDITPELFLYAALSEYALYEDMRPLVQEMLRKQPQNEDATSLAAWLKRRTGR